MILTTDQIERLQIASQPLMYFLSDPEFHPHIKVTATSTDTEIFESLAQTTNTGNRVSEGLREILDSYPDAG
jgi:hypothetical protein